MRTDNREAVFLHCYWEKYYDKKPKVLIDNRTKNEEKESLETYVDRLTKKYCVLSDNEEEKNIKPYPKLDKNGNEIETYFIRAPMKLGKTKQVIDYINKYVDVKQRVIIVSFWKTFTENMYERYNRELKDFNFKKYWNIQGQIKNQNVIIQYESLHWLESDNPDLLILDEIESIFEQIKGSDSFIQGAMLLDLIENS